MCSLVVPPPEAIWRPDQNKISRRKQPQPKPKPQTMMSTFTLSPSTATSMVGALLLCCSLFSLGSVTAAIAVARSTTTMPMPTTRPTSTVTMMAMTAGSRTLIEIGNNNRDGSPTQAQAQAQPQFRIDITYLDDDYENGLLILRRANINDDNDNDNEKKKNVKHEIHFNPLLQKSFQAMKNPIVASILIGNAASMIGLIPLGLSGFLPAISTGIFGRKLKTMNWSLRVKQLKDFASSAVSKVIKEKDENPKNDPDASMEQAVVCIFAEVGEGGTVPEQKEQTTENAMAPNNREAKEQHDDER
ncbi:hypothetical protein FRACYDRAFT_249107 [Fragilariopsis cylindrus CCMP1102]|uniref:Uncharacterized protein n=1 Tax=Fragilariopsis cylindrus CCMP1102 TaxID=635003 RepID=A0A1E7ETM4_9STRA|nr:hypothetical protein FRACYDRAFT_249107 [Fragilariopsis cylindrus CCMP1102]|eukprot:OEU09187.1 hypothetical protein FRACYDRAFT_249107 [Fragilariopsis cylindrus CCMP1102]